MRYKSVVIAAVVIMGILAFFSGKLFSSSDEKVSGSIYDFKIKDLGGNVVNFETFRGKSMLIVNTASRCGYTPQYETLQELHETYSDKVAALGFPSHNFLWQEPRSNEATA